MTPNDFWHIIEQARPASHSIAEFNHNLGRALAALPDEDLLYFHDFFEHYETAVIASPNQLIWSALSLVHGGKHAYHTYGFAAWLILQGKSTYLAVLHDADRLADTAAAPDYCSGCLKGHEHEFPEQRYLAGKIYRERTRTGIRAFKKTAAEFAKKAHAQWQNTARQELDIPVCPRDRNWTMEDLAAVLPNTYRKYILHQHS
ncbi:MULTISPECIES: DUF4240 domain-containing protein [Eikenella]|uniref:DUF4240 domain-containing protein n=1 Tax=Eikenella longinqua TaxID=1795827 RepID=A0A1A9S3B2_9NEIS|nr:MULTISPECIES: DUF4240 domain-containing protein [Eikenella]OAM31147.1 hypothetical protein A7P95_01195 [Eikenella longinqua]